MEFRYTGVVTTTPPHKQAQVMAAGGGQWVAIRHSLCQVCYRGPGAAQRHHPARMTHAGGSTHRHKQEAAGGQQHATPLAGGCSC